MSQNCLLLLERCAGIGIILGMKATLFGPLCLEDEEQRPCPLPPTANGRTLLAYLLLYAGQAHGRSQLAALLAPDDSEERARRALTQALWQVRRALPNGAILTSGDTVQLDEAHIARDVAAFDRLLAEAFMADQVTPTLAAQLADGAALYQADLLSDIYDDWVYLPREQRREQYLHTLELLAGWEKQNGRLPAALTYTLKLTQTDPLRESAHREVMRLYAALERPQAARQHYEQFRRYLQAEMGLPPAPKTQQLAAAIGAAAGMSELDTAVYLPLAAPALPYALGNAAAMPLIGREAERGQLVGQLRQLGQGQGGLVFLNGAPGVGKSRLLQELARDAEWRGLAVAWGYGRELDAMPPYTLLRQPLGSLLTPLRWQQLHALLDDHWLQLARPLLTSVEHSPQITDYELQANEHDYLEALTRLLLALGRLRPLLLILDDVQWADQASLEALLFLCHRLRQQPLLVVLAFRSVEARAETAVWQILDALDAVGLRLRLRLEPLTAAETAEFISQGLGLRQSAPLFSQRLHAETQGIPLLLLESLRLLHDEGLLYRDEYGGWRTPYDSDTASYAELSLPSHSPVTATLLERRRRQLPPAAQETLQLAAVLGRDVPFVWLLAASDQPQTETLAALSLLVQRQFLQETAQAYRFSHDKIREGVYEQIPPARRIAYHRAVAAAIAAAGQSRQNMETPPEGPTAVARLAYHYQQGEQWPEALHYTLLAADEARDLQALATALAGYAAARQIMTDHHPLPDAEADQLEYRILISRQPLLFLAGQTAQQAAELADLRHLAARLPDPAQQATILLKEADFMARVRAEHGTAVTLAQQALALAQQHQLPRLEAEAWGVIGEARHVQGAYQESGAALRQAVALWEQLGDAPHALLGAYSQLLHSERMNGRWAEGKALADRLLVLAKGMGDQMALGRAHAALGNFFSDEGDSAAAGEQFTAAMTIFRRLGARLHEARALANLGYTHWVRRDYGRAIEMKEAALALFQELENQKGILLSYLNLAALYYDAGQMAQGEAYTRRGLALAQQLELPNYTVSLQIGRAQTLLSYGELAAGAALLQAAAPLVAQEEERHIQAGFRACWGMWFTENGRYAEAAAAFAEAADLFAQEGHTDFVTAMRSFQAFALWRMGELAEAQRLSAAAVAALEKSNGGEFVLETYWHHSQIIPETQPDYLEKAYNTAADQAASLPDPAWQEMFWARPLPQTIRAAWAAAQPRRVRVWLPKKGEAAGGRTAVDQQIEIEWTPYHPVDTAVTDKVTRRQQQLTRLLAEAEAQGARPTIAALAEALDSSQPTIKRDLAVLRGRGELNRNWSRKRSGKR